MDLSASVIIGFGVCLDLYPILKLCNMGKVKINPREHVNIFSLLTFGYTIALFKKGIKTDLDEEGLYDIPESCRSKGCGDKTELQWDKSHSIYKLLWARFGVEYGIICLATIAWTQLYSITQPYGVSRLISYFEENQTRITKTDAYYCAGIVAILKVLSFFFWQNISLCEYNCGIKIRASLKSLLYRKALRLSPAAFSDTNLGNIVTILTKDINAIDENVWMVNELVSAFVQTCTISYLLWAKMGNSSFIGIGLLLLTIPIQVYLSILLTRIRLKVGANSDKRLQLTQEALTSIKIIKMYTWENFFYQKISETRNKEVVMMMKAQFLKFAIGVVGLLISKLTFLILILSYTWMGYIANTELIFYVLSLYSDLTTTFGYTIPINTTRAAEFRAAFIRLNKLLHAQEIKIVQRKENCKPSLDLKKVTVKITDKEILTNVSFRIDYPGLTLVTGAVGSGKSSLLKTILQDCCLSEGDINIQGSVSYASQEPWLFPASIRQNIVFGEKYDNCRYDEVIKVCALEYDFSLFECGDQTIVADRGLNLSKGQQARINLARAIYKNSDIYLLDDPLAALDGRIQKFIFTECIKKFLNGKICVLVTQNASHVDGIENVIVMDHGRIRSNGEWNKGNRSGKPSTAGDENNEFKPFESNNLIKPAAEIEQDNVYHENRKTGKVELAVYKKYFDCGGGLPAFFLIMFLFVLAQICESYSDQLLANWVDLQQEVLDLKLNKAFNETILIEIVSRKDSTFTWYTVLIIVKSTLGLLKFYALLRFCRRASLKIHEIMASRVIKAVMSFFDTHFIGNILNRFSHDLYNIDEDLPFLFPELTTMIFICGGAVILLATVNWILFIPTCLFITGLILMRIGYLKTGRCLKRLEATTRSPLVGHINSSLEGLTTIRAFKAQKILEEQFDVHQDLFSSAYFTLVCTLTGFGFFMDTLSGLFAILVMIRFVFFDHDISAGNVGLALTQVIILTDCIQWVIRQWAQIENNMTSVERVLEYTNIRNESKEGGEIRNWPTEGAITYENVSLTYENTTRPVLKNISFSIKPRQKIGIVGRTGAGKSSIISTLFKLYKNDGKILIDGVDTTNLCTSFLRKNIAIIPQDPILFCGTIRNNIDPNGEYDDDIIWKAIDRVKIKDFIPSLDLQIKENGLNFSAGQKQLVCMVRATVRKYKIVVLDEATANMDSATDAMLNKVMEELFSECTVLTVAHRFHTILNCDVIIVMERGEIVEIDNPNSLLKSDSTMFYKMYKESGLEK